MSYPLELWDSFHVVQQRGAEGRAFVDKLQQWFHKRATYEKEYAKKLQSLSKWPDKDNGTMQATWEVVLAQTEQEAQLHIVVADKIIAACESALSDYMRATEKDRNNLLSQGKQLVKDLKKAESDQKAAQTAEENAQTKLTEASSELEKAKFNNNVKLQEKIGKTAASAQKTLDKASSSHTDAQARLKDCQKRMWETEMPVVLAGFQQLDKTRHTNVKTSFHSFTTIQKEHSPQFNSCYESVENSAQSMDADSDMEAFVSQYRTGAERPGGAEAAAAAAQAAESVSSIGVVPTDGSARKKKSGGLFKGFKKGSSSSSVAPTSSTSTIDTTSTSTEKPKKEKKKRNTRSFIGRSSSDKDRGSGASIPALAGGGGSGGGGASDLALDMDEPIVGGTSNRSSTIGGGGGGGGGGGNRGSTIGGAGLGGAGGGSNRGSTIGGAGLGGAAVGGAAMGGAAVGGAAMGGAMGGSGGGGGGGGGGGDVVMGSHPVLCRVRGVFDYEPQDPQELSFKKGEIIDVIQKDPSGWWHGHIDGRVGVFPSVDWVEEIADGAPPSGGNPFADVGGGGGGGGGGMGGGAGGANPFDELCDPANVRGPVNSNAMMVEYEIMYDFTGQLPGELTVSAGTRATGPNVVDSQGWIHVTTHTGLQGKIPASYTQQL